MNDSKAFMNTQIMRIIFIKLLKENNSNKKGKILIIFDDMIADILSNKKLNPIETVSFIRCRKLNIFFVFITQSCLALPKNRLNYTHYFIMKIQNNNENFNKLLLVIHKILTLKTLWIFTKKCTAKPYSYLVIDAIVVSDNPSRFRTMF